jgi:hypothetical protein
VQPEPTPRETDGVINTLDWEKFSEVLKIIATVVAYLFLSWPPPEGARILRYFDAEGKP